MNPRLAVGPAIDAKATPSRPIRLGDSRAGAPYPPRPSRTTPTLPRKKQDEPDSHERWLVSYADFVTLLFAFFVVLFSSATVDQAKIRALAAEFQAMANQPVTQSAPRLEQMLGAADVASGEEALSLAEMNAMADRIRAELLPEIEHGKIELSIQPRGLVMSLSESGFFAAGEADLQTGSNATLDKVGATLAEMPGEIRLEGHSDDRPIRTQRYPSNWHLSAARAINMLKWLVTDHGLSPTRLAAAGYGESRPLVPNDTEDNRAKNRRVDIVVLNEAAAAAEPQQIAPAQP